MKILLLILLILIGVVVIWRALLLHPVCEQCGQKSPKMLDYYFSDDYCYIDWQCENCRYKWREGE